MQLNEITTATHIIKARFESTNFDNKGILGKGDLMPRGKELPAIIENLTDYFNTLPGSSGNFHKAQVDGDTNNLEITLTGVIDHEGGGSDYWVIITAEKF